MCNNFLEESIITIFSSAVNAISNFIILIPDSTAFLKPIGKVIITIIQI